MGMVVVFVYRFLYRKEGGGRERVREKKGKKEGGGENGGVGGIKISVREGAIELRGKVR